MPSNLALIDEILKKKALQPDALPVIGPGPTMPEPSAILPSITPAAPLVPQHPALPVITPPEMSQAMQPVIPVITPQGSPVVQPAVELPAIGGKTPEQQLVDIRQKEYGIQKDENGKVTYRGKDRDKKWSIWDKIASAAVGWATGGLAGGVKAATDRNYFEKMGDQFQQQRLLPVIEAGREQAKFDTDQAYRKAQTGAVIAAPEIKREQNRINEERYARDAELKGLTLDWKKDDRDRYFELEDLKLKARGRNDDRTYDLAVKKQAEIERNNKAKIEQGDRKETGVNKRLFIKQKMAKELAEYKAALESKKMDKAAEIKARLEGLQLDYDSSEN